MRELLAITSEQKQFFDDNGYLLIEGLYSPEEITEMRARFIELLKNPDKQHRKLRYSMMESPDESMRDPDNPFFVHGMMDTPLGSDYWFENIRDPKVVDVVVDLLGPNINFHNGKARLKPPGHRNTQSWHQDWPYERHSEPDLLAALIYLEDTDENSGATEVVPGSHKQGEWPTIRGHTIADELVGGRGVVLKAKAGDVAFVHVLVVHRGGHNVTRQSKSAIINEYKTAEARDLWGNPCAFADLPLRRGGRPY